ncbi:MAG: hypothetical protein H0X17_19565 [Deltaproteobacteria bacterium]|nr:hypothetical protein [Deltaproteobacteria bacterium]
MNPLGKLVLALSSLLLLSAAIVTSESALIVRIGFLTLALVGAVWSIVRYRQERRGEAP